MSDPNSWSPVKLVNNWGGEITSVKLNHRYDDDHHDNHEWASLADGAEGTGMQAGYWTGPLRTGKDYWQVSFNADGNAYACKNNFYCSLTSDDAESGRAVVVTIKAAGDLTFHVAPPVSSSCNVSLAQVG